MPQLFGFGPGRLSALPVGQQQLTVLCLAHHEEEVPPVSSGQRLDDAACAIRHRLRPQ